MARSTKLDQLLDELQSLRQDPSSAAALPVLQKALRGSSGYAAAKAAQIAAEGERSDVLSDLTAAFERFCSNPVKSDPGCRAKAAIAEALYRLAYDDPALFLRGIRYRQMEPVYGGRIDTAGELRAACAFGLVRINYPDTLNELAELLADPEAQVRGAAAQALAYSGIASAAAVLRLKALTGDTEPAVIGECLTALLKLDADTALPFAARFLDDDQDAIAEAAALALGASRLAAAFPRLRAWWERTPAPALRRTALLATAMIRRDEALAFLLDLITGGTSLDARDAIGALRIYRHDETVKQQVAKAVTSRGDPAVSAVAAEQLAAD